MTAYIKLLPFEQKRQAKAIRKALSTLRGLLKDDPTIAIALCILKMPRPQYKQEDISLNYNAAEYNAYSAAREELLEAVYKLG